MDKPMSDSHFKMMSLVVTFRDMFHPRKPILDELEINEGAQILDFGCGPGSYSLIAAGMAGPTGKVYALDIHSMAIERVRRAAAKKKLTNIETILSDCATGLDNDSMDIVFLYDIFHELSEADAVLKELHRVLKPDGLLAMSDHHLEEPDIIKGMTGNGLFKLIKKGRKSYIFGK